MQVAAGGLIFGGFLLTLICAVWRRRTAFGNMLLLGGAFVIAANFANEAKNHLVLAWTTVPFVAVFLTLCARAVLRFMHRADAEVWYSAGMRGAFFLWQSGRIAGAEARTFWLLQAVCSGMLALGILASVTVALTRTPPAPPADPDVGIRVRIKDAGEILSTFNKVNEQWVRWPSPEVRAQAGADAWGTWKPRTDDTGTVVGTMEDPEKGKILVLALPDGTGSVHYAVIGESGIEWLGR